MIAIARMNMVLHDMEGEIVRGNTLTNPKFLQGPSLRQFEVVVTVDNPDNRYRPGQQAYVRFRLEKRPLIWQWGRRFWQLIQQENRTASWM